MNREQGVPALSESDREVQTYLEPAVANSSNQQGGNRGQEMLGRVIYLSPEQIAIAGLVDEIDQRIRSRNDKRD